MKNIVFSQQARADVRRLDPQIATRIFAALHRFAQTGVGDIKRLQGESKALRLRVGQYRVRLTEEVDSYQILRVLHRKDAYR